MTFTDVGRRPMGRSGLNFSDWLFGAALSDCHRRAGAALGVRRETPKSWLWERTLSDNLNYFLRLSLYAGRLSHLSLRLLTRLSGFIVLRDTIIVMNFRIIMHRQFHF